MAVEVVSIIVESLVTIAVFLAFFFGFKYWLDKDGVNKTLTKINEDQSCKISKLRAELKAYKRLNSDFEFLLKKKQEEVAALELRVECLKEELNKGGEDGEEE